MIKWDGCYTEVLHGPVELLVVIKLIMLRLGRVCIKLLKNYKYVKFKKNVYIRNKK